MAERKILIAVDENECSEKAFDFYLDQIRRENDHVIVLIVKEPQPPFAVQDHSRESEHKRMKDEEEAVRRKLLGKKYKSKCKEFNVQMTMCIEEGHNHGEKICQVAKEKDVVMIVMGSRGHGAVRRTILGSVSDYTLHHADVPVLVVSSKAKIHGQDSSP